MLRAMSILPRQLLPDHATIGLGGQLAIAGVDVAELAEQYGTPLFIYDEEQLRARWREAEAAFGAGATYATKAFLCKAMARLAHEEGMHLDVASGGELFVALAAGVPADRLIMHGNNKSLTELRECLRLGVGRIVVDSFDELDRLEQLVESGGLARPTVLLRITPGIEAHTHEFVRTGQNDSKFGFNYDNGDAAKAVARARESQSVDLIGLHAHIGSQVFTTESFAQAVEVLAGITASASRPSSTPTTQPTRAAGARADAVVDGWDDQLKWDAWLEARHRDLRLGHA